MAKATEEAKKVLLPENLLGSILDAAPVGVVVIDQEGTIVRFNGEAERLFGYTSDEILGERIETLVPKHIREKHPSLRRGYFANPEVRFMGIGLDLSGRRKDGSEFPLEISLNAVTSGKQTYGIAAISDITSRIKERDKEQAKLEKIQQLELAKVSTPLLDVWDDVIVLPLVGVVDSFRAQQAMEKSLTAMGEKRASILIIDITGVLVMDTMVADTLLQMSAAIRLMGGEAIITGISPQMAHTIIRLGVDISGLHSRSTLAQGLVLAIELAKEGGRR
ncbi:MAG: PAS domain S-box protein [Proteobacteria bacterium]|nr:PAS domain S-box protein [Pseudomonadota bacterium]